jgi:hypothetical protein
MNKYSKIADGLAGWLNFEKRAKRESLFSEYYLAQPLGQLLHAQFAGEVQAEVPHPILSSESQSRGRKPSIDFVVSKQAQDQTTAVETKWVSKSPNLLRDIVRDVIRLDLLVPTFAQEGILVVAGLKRDFKRLFENKYFRPHPDHLSSKHILPLGEEETASIRFVPIPKFRRRLYESALDVYRERAISCSIAMARSGPFPRDANSDQYRVYLWRIRKHVSVQEFVPNDVYFGAK